MADGNGCSLCANTIIGTHFGDVKKRHRVLIDGESMTIYEEGGTVRKKFNVCPVNLRQLEESSEQF